jgi:parallel beta-helix repeat protein
MADAHKNFAYSTVATAPSPASSGTSLVVAAGEGALFPAVPFNATVWPTGTNPLSTNAEIVRVTNIATDTLTITRAQESSGARTVVVGDQIAATITAQTLTVAEIVTKVVATTGGDYATVSDALAAASNNWSIRVKPGSYTEGGVTGLALSNVSVVADDPYATTLSFGANNMNVSGIANFTMTGVAVTFTTGYLNLSGNYSVMRNCRITRTSNNNANNMTFNGTGLQVTDCYLNYQGSSTAVGFAYSGGNFQVWNNNVWEVAPAYDNGGAQGTIRFAGAYTTVTGNIFSTLSNATKNLISIEGGNIVFSSNSMNDGFGNTNCAKMIVVTSASNVVSGNVIQGSALGISVQGSGTDSVISNNQLNATKVGILISATTNARNSICNNVLYGTGTAVTGSIGISATGNHCTIVGNSVQNHKDGIIIQTGATKNNASANVVLNNGTNFTDSGTSTEVAGANITA